MITRFICAHLDLFSPRPGTLFLSRFPWKLLLLCLPLSDATLQLYNLLVNVLCCFTTSQQSVPIICRCVLPASSTFHWLINISLLACSRMLRAVSRSSAVRAASSTAAVQKGPAIVLVDSVRHRLLAVPRSPDTPGCSE